MKVKEFLKKNFFVIAVVLGIVIFLIGMNLGYKESNSGGTVKPVLLTPENLPAYMERNSIINDLPISARVEVHFGDNVYSVEDGVIKTAEISDPDIVVRIPDTYLNKEWPGLCSLVKTANTNRDLAVEINIPKTSAAFKYRGMAKYRDCL